MIISPEKLAEIKASVTYGEFYSAVCTDDADEALTFLLLILGGYSDNAANKTGISEDEAFESVLRLYSRGFLLIQSQDDGSFIISPTTPEDSAARGFPLLEEAVS